MISSPLVNTPPNTRCVSDELISRRETESGHSPTHTLTLMDELCDAAEEDICLRVGYRLLMIISCRPLVTAISCIHQGDTLSLSSPSRRPVHLTLDLCVSFVCQSASEARPLLLSALRLDVNMRFVICLVISQHFKTL